MLIDEAAFDQLFESFGHTAFRLETREQYVEDDEDESLQQFLAGQPVDESWIDEWGAYIRSLAAAGKRFERVRVVSEPHSDYTRYGLDQSRLNVAVGEDVRYLPRSRAVELALPDEDFWLFDSRIALVFRFGADGRIIGRELLEDPAEIVERNYWRDVAWHYAIRREEYAAAYGVV